MTELVLNQLLDVDILVNARCRPRYSTDVVTTDGGYDITNSRWRYPLHQVEFDMMPGYRTDDDAISVFVDTFHVVGGCAGVFRFHYWRDLPVVNQQIGTGDGATTQFQLYKLYQREALTRRRKVTRPVPGSLTVYQNGVPVAVGIDYETGIITFGVAPPNGAVITADFEYDIPVRFADDEIELIGLTSDLDQPVSIVLKEVREPGLSEV